MAFNPIVARYANFIVEHLDYEELIERAKEAIALNISKDLKEGFLSEQDLIDEMKDTNDE
jgi:hypothetical protein